MTGAEGEPVARRGLMLVLSSPSGAGKSTLSRMLLEADASVELSVSATTRPQRPAEVDGRDYHFVTRARFDEMIGNDELLEWAEVFGNRYGTPRAPVEAALARGHDVLFDIDWQGTQQLRDKVAKDFVSVFLLPPSVPELERRLTTRAQDSDEVIRGRMAKAWDEMSHWAEYDYVIVNDNLDASLRQVQAILEAERKRRTRQVGLSDFVNALRTKA
jgi:guanylate kinase